MTLPAPRVACSLIVCIGLLLVGSVPVRAQWGDSYDAPQRRSRDVYRDDSGYGARQANRRYAPPPQEAPRQFYWPWEDRPQQAQPAPVSPSARQPPRQRGPSYADDPRSSREDTRPVRRRPRPVPLVAQPKPVAPKAEPATRIAVFGDSLAGYLSSGLDDVFEDNADVGVLDRSKPDSGLVRKDVVDWPKAAEDFLKANPKVAFALVMLGANDRQPIRDNDQSVEPLSERWRALYAERVDAMVKVFTDRKIPLIWVGTPPMKSESLAKDLAVINDICRERVARAGQTYVDIWPGFVDDRNRYAANGPDLEGQEAKLRTSDGVHFTKAGARKVAHFADVELKRLMGAGSPEQPAAPVATAPMPTLDNEPVKLDDAAAIDRQITAMLPSLPEPPGIPALPIKPLAGPVLPLGRSEITPGGTLISSRPRDGDPTGNVERALLRGAAPLPQPGRADDFKWPPG
ncbi:SGNH family hydrolase [Methylobacterium sp. BTF04]|uniref:SGNH/GDSL hydrolase family protein n=1 Tax=Methylobacterium sp. BTF04 TaxID=2708300 RepID=UPI0019532AA5|nr:SGNH family hydrolase [Methylobacterium sp. BTF04]